MSGVRVVQLFHKERRNDRAYEVIAGDFQRHFMSQRRAWAYFRPVATTLSAGGIAMVLWVCGDAVLRGAGLDPAQMAVIGAISVGVLVTYLTSMALLPALRVPMEIGIYGGRLAALRLLACAALPPVAGLIAAAIVRLGRP